MATAHDAEPHLAYHEGLTWIKLSWIYPRSILLFVLYLRKSCVLFPYSLSMQKNIMVLIGALLSEDILVIM